MRAASTLTEGQGTNQERHVDAVETVWIFKQKLVAVGLLMTLSLRVLVLCGSCQVSIHACGQQLAASLAWHTRRGGDKGGCFLLL